MLRCGCVEHGLECITFYVQKHTAPLAVCSGPPLVWDGSLEAPVFVRLTSYTSHQWFPFVFMSTLCHYTVSRTHTQYKIQPSERNLGLVWCNTNDLLFKNQLLTHWPHGRFDYSLKLVHFKLISMINILSIFCEIAIRWMPQHLIDH